MEGKRRWREEEEMKDGETKCSARTREREREPALCQEIPDCKYTQGLLTIYTRLTYK